MANKKKKKHAKAKKFASHRAATKKKVAKKETLPKKAALKETVLKKMKALGKSQSVNTVAFEPEGRGGRVRAANLGICRECPTSREQIRRAWTNCLRKEMRSRLKS
jgi:hypothetical protein